MAANTDDMSVDKDKNDLLVVILKTLDGQNKEFSLPKTITVSGFKDEICKTLSIPPAQQRLIFQGKVLQDTKQLQEYGVSDKVVHLVPRPPPSSANSGSVPSSSTRSRARSERPDDVTDINAVQNMVESILSSMGELGQRADVTAQPDGSGFDILVNINPQNHRMSLARIRQMYLLRIEEQARSLLRYLADPVNNTLPGPDYQVLRQDSPFQTIGREANSTNSESAQPQDPPPADNVSASSQEGSGATSTNNEPLPITALADMMDRVRALNAEAEPYIVRWQTMLRDDADLGDRAEEAQKFYDTVNRLLHLLSHMMHNISDFIVEFNNDTQRPRHLLVLSETPVQSVQTRIHIDSATDGPPFRLARRPASIDRSRLSRSSTATTNIPASNNESDSSPNTQHNDRPTSEQIPATSGDPSNPHRRSLSATRVGNTNPPNYRTELGRGLLSRNRSGNSFNRIQTSDGGVYVTASTQPRTFVEMRPNAMSVNSLSAHIVAAAVDVDRDSNNGRTATNQQTSSDSATDGDGSANHQNRDNSPVIGMPRELLQQVLESALRNSFEMTDIGPEAANNRDSSQQQQQQPSSGTTRTVPFGNYHFRSLPPQRSSANIHVGRAAASNSTNPTAAAANSLGSVLRGSLNPGGHAMHPSCGVDPYLPCHSRHYMDHDSVNESLEGRRLAMGSVRQGGGVAPDSSAGNSSTTPRNESSSGNRVIREVHMFPILPRVGGFSASFANGGQMNSGSAPQPATIRNNMEAMSNVLSAMLGGAVPPGLTAHSGRTGTSTTNTATTGNAGNTSTTTGSSASTGANSGSVDFHTLQNMMTAMLGALNPNQTRLNDFFSQITGSTLLEESPASLLGDASNHLLNEWSISDVINLLFLHDRRPLDRLRIPFQNLIAVRERDSGNRERVIEDIILDCRQIYLPAIQENEFGDIDVGESVGALLRHHLSQLLSLVADSPTDTGFGGLVMAHLTHLCEELIILLQLICNDDDARLERLLLQIFDSWANTYIREQQPIRSTPYDFSVLYQWMSSMLRSNTSRMMSHEVENLRRNVSRFIVHKQSSAAAEDKNDQSAQPPDTNQNKPAAPENGEVASEMDCSEFGTPPASSTPCASGDVSFSETAFYLIDCIPSAEDLPENPLAPHPDTTYPLRRNPNDEGSLSSGEPEVMDTSGTGSSPDWNNECGAGVAVGTNSGIEGWHAVLPQEWVQVVARDVETQRQSLSRPLSFSQNEDPASNNNCTLSDAYLAGMPAKRRKLMLAAKEVIIQPANLLLGDCVSEAVRQSGFSPSPQSSSNDLGAASAAVASSDVNRIAPDNPLSQAFKDYVTEKMSHRLEHDQDYLPEQFPDSERVFRGRNKTNRKSPSAFSDKSFEKPK